MGLVTAEDVRVAAEEILRDPLAGVLARATQLEWGDPFETAVEEWTQVPSLQALTSARLPAGAIVTPGLTEKPVRRRSSGYTAAWRLVVGLYDRGEDYAATQTRIGRWAGLIRWTIVDSRNLGGFASDVVWVGEEYAERPERSSARTLAGCAVAFDVTVEDVLGVTPTGPLVGAPASTVTVR